LAVRSLRDEAAVLLDPGARPQVLIVRDGDDGDLSRTLRVRPRVQRQHDLAIRRAVEQSIDAVGSGEVDAVDREDEISGVDVDPGAGERRPQIRIPALTVVD